MQYPYIKITIEEFHAPKEGERYGERYELATQIINREWFFEFEMLSRIMAVIYNLEPKIDMSQIRKQMRGE